MRENIIAVLSSLPSRSCNNVSSIYYRVIFHSFCTLIVDPGPDCTSLLASIQNLLSFPPSLGQEINAILESFWKFQILWCCDVERSLFQSKRIRVETRNITRGEFVIDTWRNRSAPSSAGAISSRDGQHFSGWDWEWDVSENLFSVADR